MKVYIIIGEIYEYGSNINQNVIVSIHSHEQKANDELAFLSERLESHLKLNPLNGKNEYDISDEIQDQYIEWTKINPFDEIQNGNDIENFILKEYIVK